VTEGALPPDKESAACLFEFRGGVEAYCQSAASRLASPASRFVVCDTSLAIARVNAAAVDAGLVILRRLDVIPKTGKPPLFSVWVMRLRDSVKVSVATDAASSRLSSETESNKCVVAEISARTEIASPHGEESGSTQACKSDYLVETITARDEAGAHTPAYRTLLVEMGKLAAEPAVAAGHHAVE
jgi:hypothetical protein